MSHALGGEEFPQIVIMCHVPSREAFSKVVATCHSRTGKDSYKLMVTCLSLNGDDFQTCTLVPLLDNMGFLRFSLYKLCRHLSLYIEVSPLMYFHFEICDVTLPKYFGSSYLSLSKGDNLISRRLIFSSDVHFFGPLLICNKITQNKGNYLILPKSEKG